MVFWALYWCPVADVRNTLTGFSYNLGLALFVSTQFDVETYLADLNAYFGCFFAGLYILMFVIFSIAAIYYAEVYHSWDKYLNDEDINENEQDSALEEQTEDPSLAAAI